jgi:hypothetical protein
MHDLNLEIFAYSYWFGGSIEPGWNRIKQAEEIDGPKLT